MVIEILQNEWLCLEIWHDVSTNIGQLLFIKMKIERKKKMLFVAGNYTRPVVAGAQWIS